MFAVESAGFVDSAAALAGVVEAARLTNAAAARMVLAAADAHALCIAEDLARLPREHHRWAGAGARSDVATALGTSGAAAQQLIDVGTQLRARLPRTRQWFLAGVLDLAKVKVIADELGQVADAVVDAIEAACVEAARFKGPQALRTEIERLITGAAPEEATRLRHDAESARRLDIRRGVHGTARLHALLTATEAQLARRRIEEICTTVCEHDPRRKGRRPGELRADALIALLNGETQLACRCHRDDCPVAHYTTPPRTAVITHIHLNPETLLGLVNDPVALAGYGTIDPELARALSTDATWRVIIDRARTALRPGAPTPRPLDLPAGRVAAPKPPSDFFAPLPAPATYSGAGAIIDALYTLIETTPSILTRFDGHGPHTQPPTGALTYRPGRALRRAVTARYPTCTHPNCEVPARYCQIDHAAPFNHTNPVAGGWTIPENLHPRCPFHHQLHTLGHHRIVILDNGAVLTIARTGVIGITLPDTHYTSTDTEPPPQPRPAWDTTPTPPPPEPDDLIYQPTWWETFMHPNDTAPTPAQIATITNPQHRAHCHHLRHRYHEHHAIRTAREHHRPPPF